MAKKKIIRRLSKQVTKKKKGKKVRVEFITTGSTPLNLAGSNKGITGGIARSRIFNMVGDGSSGKTLVALEIAAHFFYGIKNKPSRVFPKVKKVKVIYNNVENVMDFPVEEMYGEEFVKGVIWRSSKSVQSWGRDVGRELINHEEGTAVLYILDSLDALGSKEGRERFEKAAEDDKEEDGSYNLEKQKYLSNSFFDNICNLQKGKDFTLVIISQVRTKIGITFGKKTYRAGGKALDFYTHQVAWLAVVEKLKKTVNKKKLTYGVRSIARFERNKAAKPYREAETIMLFDYGIDDAASILAWLFGPKASITAKKLDFLSELPPLKKGKKIYDRRLLRIFFYRNPKILKELRKYVSEEWNELEEELKKRTLVDVKRDFTT